jgi:hypothetical protein
VANTEVGGIALKRFNYDPGNTNAEITFLRGSTADDAAILFKTTPGSGVLTNRMIIDKLGNVGIGTTSPAKKLHISEGDILLDNDQAIRIGDNGGTARKVLTLNTFDDVELGSTGTDNIRFTNSAGEVMRLQDSTGYLGVGTTSPESKLHLYSATANTLLLLESGDRYATMSLKDNSSTQASGISVDGDDLRILSSGTEAIRIDSNQKVGIGTTSPQGNLHVVAGNNEGDPTWGANTMILQRNTASNYVARLAIIAGSQSTSEVSFGDKDAVAIGAIIFSHSNNSMNFNAGGGTRMTIGNSGDVGIGTTSPTDKLDINSDTMRLRTAKTPSSASDTGTQGQIAWDSNYFYICVATDTWQRVAHATW